LHSNYGDSTQPVDIGLEAHERLTSRKASISFSLMLLSPHFSGRRDHRSSMCHQAAVRKQMIVVFGASTDIGQRLVEKLNSEGIACRRVSRTMSDSVRGDLRTGEGIVEAISGASVVVSCAHAEHTGAILRDCPSDIPLVLVGSAWRYSRVPNARANAVREAETQFLGSEHRGIMLHPAMIYGGNQENNIRKLLQVIRKVPFIPAPGGGRQIVCPIYVDDLVDCLNASVKRNWDGKYILGVAGPALTWRSMVTICAQAIGLRRPIVYVPARPTVWVLELIRRLGIKAIDPSVIRRFGENVQFSDVRMHDILGVNPRSFEEGILSAVENWRQKGFQL
jgi:nucleoside-diphosphate-sugar epimerase